MKAHLENILWERVSGGEFARDVAEGMLADGLIDSEKQVWRTLEKWVGKGIYEYGCVLDMGWVVKEGL